MKINGLFFTGILLATLSVVTNFGCSKDDDTDQVGPACTIDFISATKIDDSNFRVRIKNTSSITHNIAVTVRYAKNGVQRGNTGVGYGQDVTAGTTVDIETIESDVLTADAYDCATISVQVLTPGLGTPCFDDRVGDDCY